MTFAKQDFLQALPNYPQYHFYSLPLLAKHFGQNLKRLPTSLRIVLEALLRTHDHEKVTEQHLKNLINWQANVERVDEIPFTVARVVLQDFTGVPLLADLAAMRSSAQKLGKDASKIEPLVPVDLVVDHSIQVDDFANPKAIENNMQLEFTRNQERYAFMKWAMQAFKTFKVIPPGIGIVHQVNLEYLANGMHIEKNAQTQLNILYSDSLVGTDSHTTMINGAGVVGWGVGGIEAEAAMLGQPVYFLTPDVVALELTGHVQEGILATDIVLTVTELLRKHKVVGKFVEFVGEGARSLSLADRATIANMAPEYGATMGFFAVDEQTLDYFIQTGRDEKHIALFKEYLQAQGLFGINNASDSDYSQVLTLDLAGIEPSISGPKRPQDRIVLKNAAKQFAHLFSQTPTNNGFNQDADKLTQTYPTADGQNLKNGDVLIAAITSCTNTSNPSVLIAAGLLAKKAVELGLTVNSKIKTSLAPGSRVVTEYLKATGLLPYLEKLGFYVVGYGCTTCIGNAGDLTDEFNQTILQNDLICAAVLSGNRNFEARIHPNLKANFLASPPLVVAYAIAGNMQIDLTTQALGQVNGKDIYLKDIWPSTQEIQALLPIAMNADVFKHNYQTMQVDLWQAIAGKQGVVYDWPDSSYIAQPPFFKAFSLQEDASKQTGIVLKQARILALFGDSITTDHISPAGSIKESSPAGQWLIKQGVSKADFNSYGARRGHHEVMMRGTFANVRIKNLMLPAKPDGNRVEGGYTINQLNQTQESIYDCAMAYQQQNIASVIIAGEEYGNGSSRDWAAKGTYLLGVKAVIAKSFERIHRSNLIGMGVLPIQLINATDLDALNLDGSELISLQTIEENHIQAQQTIDIYIEKAGKTHTITAKLRIDTPIEIQYFKQNGILPFVLKQLIA